MQEEGGLGNNWPPVFGRSVSPIPTRADYAHHITTPPSSYCTVLISIVIWAILVKMTNLLKTGTKDFSDVKVSECIEIDQIGQIYNWKDLWLLIDWIKIVPKTQLGDLWTPTS